MRIFLSHLITFTVIGYFVMTVLDVGLSRVASSSHYGATECWENLMKGRIDADCVILGSSRAMNHVDAYQLMPNPDEMMAYYDSLASARGIPLLDYTHMWVSNDSSYFADGMHMNRKGAIIFTDSLANDLKRLEISDFGK